MLFFSSVTLADPMSPCPNPAPEIGQLTKQLESRIQRVWELRWGYKWKEVWWRLPLHGVKGAGGHGWAWAQDRRCECGWYPSVGAGGLVRSYQQRACVPVGVCILVYVHFPLVKALARSSLNSCLMHPYLPILYHCHFLAFGICLHSFA